LTTLAVTVMTMMRMMMRVCCCEQQIARQHGIPFLETSAKSNINVEKGFLDLTQAILNKVLEFTVQIIPF